jgi:L-threonylcarbamoyladenylate synthase
MTIISTDISKAVDILQNDDLVAIPTETVYGLAGNIYSEKAIKKIFALKKRPLFNPLIIHLASAGRVHDVVSEWPAAAQKLAAAFWPGPLTMVLKKKPAVPDMITAGKDTVGIRVPNHSVTSALLQQLAFPLAAPSANPFGSISPTKASHVENYFGNKLSMVLDGGDCANGVESTIVGFNNEQPVIYRLGAISLEEISSVVGHIEVMNHKELEPDAPGMLSRHYAPQTNAFLVADARQFLDGLKNKKAGVLLFTGHISHPSIQHTEILSATGNLKEAAANLYSALHNLDKLALDVIVIEKFPDIGLGKTINDRLNRATKKGD